MLVDPSGIDLSRTLQHLSGHLAGHRRLDASGRAGTARPGPPALR